MTSEVQDLSAGPGRTPPHTIGGTVARVRRSIRRTSARVRSRWLACRNRFASRPVVGEAPVVVSLTTHGARIYGVAHAVESIGAGTVRPCRIILWIDHTTDFSSLPKPLRRLQARGLEILPTEDFGPHTKYYPFVTSEASHRLPLVTADDDVLYPRYWLDRLLAAWQREPTVVHCHRASVVRTRRGELEPYAAWPRCTDRALSVTRFATGVSGVIYPPEFLDELCRRGPAFRSSSPRADDVWLHWIALQTGTQVRQVSRRPKQFMVLPGSQRQTLMSDNVHAGGNDRQIAALYTVEDVNRLERATIERL